MDLYKILQTLEQLEEGTMAAAEKHKTGPEFTGYWKGTDSGVPGDKMVGGMEEQNIGPGTGGMEEDTTGAILGGIAGAALTKTPTGALAGSRIGSEIEDNLEEELRAAWSDYLEEYGATATDTAAEKATQAKELQTAQQNINKLKSAGVAIPTGTTQATQSAVKTTSNPQAVPTTQDRQLTGALGTELEQLITKGNPSQVSQLANAIRQVKQGIK